MVKRISKRDEEGEEVETEIQPLITTKVVEYLEPVMSQDLLCKFPDNSALGFDYSQSSLWSPLLPRNHHGRALELGEEKNTKMKMLMMTMKKKMKSKFLGFDVSASKKKNKTKNTKMESGLSADPVKFGCFVISSKGWDGLLKAASKHFKKTKKKRDSIGDVKLLNYIKC